MVKGPEAWNFILALYKEILRLQDLEMETFWKDWVKKWKHNYCNQHILLSPTPRFFVPSLKKKKNSIITATCDVSSSNSFQFGTP